MKSETVKSEGRAQSVDRVGEIVEFGEDGRSSRTVGAIRLPVEQAASPGGGAAQRGKERVAIFRLELGPADVHSFEAVGFGHDPL